MTLAPSSGQSELKTRHNGRDAQGIGRVCGEKKRKQVKPGDLIIALFPRDVCSQKDL